MIPYLPGVFMLMASALLAIVTAICIYIIQPYFAIFKWVSIVHGFPRVGNGRRPTYLNLMTNHHFDIEPVLQKLKFDENGEIYQLWAKPPVDLYVRVYLFNVTNSEAFISGVDKTLNVQEVGPYVYK